MSRRTWIIVGVIVALVAIGGGVAWYLFSGGDEAGPALPTRASGASGANASSASPDGTWVITSDGTFVGYRISERFAGGLTDIEAIARTSEVTGGFTVGDGSVSDVEVEADLGSLTSDKVLRDNYIRTRALETDTYPTATFVATGPIRLPKVTRGTETKVTLDGTFTLHGVTKPLSIPVTARWNGDTIDVIGTAPIVLADYGIQSPQTPLVSVAGNGSLELQLVLVPKG